MDWQDEAWSGIADDATLLVLNKIHLEDAFIITENISEGSAALKLKINIRNASWERFGGRIRVEIRKWLPVEAAQPQKEASFDVYIRPMETNEQCITLNIENPDLWSVDSPELYCAHIILCDNKGRELDDIYETFGIRTIKIVDRHFYINNKKTILRGTHDFCKYQGDSMLCPDDRSIVKDILLHKKMGANCSRWPSDIRMHYKRIAQYCDQLGFMTTWCGYFEMWTIHPEAEMYAARDVKAMVRSLMNCPSIVIWEMGDEPLWFTHPYRRHQWYKTIYGLVHEEDQTRPILPGGHFCCDMLEQLEKYEKGTPVPQGRKIEKFLADFPVYNMENTFWDIHYTPAGVNKRPATGVTSNAIKALDGNKPLVITEFGMDGLPDYRNVIGIYGRFRWSRNIYYGGNRRETDLSYFDREIRQEDWKESQAAQCALMSNILGCIREHPEKVAGYYFVTLIDVWTFYWGVADAAWKCKLSFFVAQNLFKPLYISGLHGNVLLRPGDSIRICVSNYEEALADASVKVQIRNMNGEAVREDLFQCGEIKGDSSLTWVAELLPGKMDDGMYSIEYYLYDRDGAERAKTLEMFVIRMK